MNKKQKTVRRKHPKGTASICIAVVFITLQIMLMIGGLYVGPSEHQGANVSFHNPAAIVQSVVFLLFTNILGIGALVLSLIVWLYHKNVNGKVTTIIASVVIIVNSLCLSLTLY